MDPVKDTDHDGIDDRWLIDAATRLREVTQAQEQIKQHEHNIVSLTKRRDASAAALVEVKKAIAAKAPFVEPPKK